MKRFYLSSADKKIGGVCGGLAEYFNIDSTFVRLLFVLFALAGGLTIFIYIVLWIVSPRSPGEGHK